MKYYRLLNIFLVKFALRRSRRSRQGILKILDVATFSLSIYLAIAIRFETFLLPEIIKDRLWQVLVLLSMQFCAFHALGIYRSILRYSSLRLIESVAKAVTLSTLLLIALTYFGGDWALTRSVLIVNALLVLVFSVSLRLLLRWVIRNGLLHSEREVLSERSPQRLVIYGAGAAGVELLNALHYSPCYKVVGFVDDDSDLQKRARIESLNIYAPSQLSALWQEKQFDSVVLAMPSISLTSRRRIITALKRQSISVKTVPALSSILSGKVTIQELRDVEISDLLGRTEVVPNLELLQRQIRSKSVLVTGAGGSIGSELCRQIVRQQPNDLVLYERHEFALYKIHQELTELSSNTRIVACLGSVTDGPYLRSVLKENCVETVYHTAAYKHVPLLESNISKAVENNVLGTLNVTQSSIEAGVGQFVLISTDKAVRPTNIMGATKRIAELIVQALSERSSSLTRCAIVRFGNVLGSSGSVVPRFRHQIAKGGPITLTHPEITRYFMSIPEAARLVIQAGAMADGGEVFLLDMGKPVKIYDLAVQMIRLSGLIPEEDVQIKITGLRPGEKLYEELLISDERVRPTYHPKIYCSKESFIEWEKLEPRLHQLLGSARTNNLVVARALLRSLVPEYTPQEQVSARIPQAATARKYVA